MLCKGTVIETNGNRAFVLNSMCEYQEVRITGTVQPGQEISYSIDQVCKKQHYPSFKKFAFVAASFVLLFLFSFNAYQQAGTRSVYAYIALDINPSLEIGINKDYKIIETKGFNDEARALIKDSSILDTDLELALSKIINECSAKGYLVNSQINYIALSLYFPGNIDNNALVPYLDSQITKVLALNNLNTEIYYLMADENTREEALKNNVSSTRYMLWEQSEIKGLHINQPEDISLKDREITQLASEIAAKVVHCSQSQEQLDSKVEDITDNLNNVSNSTSSRLTDSENKYSNGPLPSNGEPSKQELPADTNAGDPAWGYTSPEDHMNSADKQDESVKSGNNSPIDSQIQKPVNGQSVNTGEQIDTSEGGGSGGKK